MATLGLVNADFTLASFDVGGVNVGGDGIRFGGKNIDRRTINAAGAVFSEGSHVVFYQPPTPIRETKAERIARERAEREQSLLDKAYELLIMIKDPDMPVDGKNFRAKEEELEVIVKQIQKDQPRKYYRTSNEGIEGYLSIEFVERLDKEFATQPECAGIYYEDAGYETELAEAKFRAGAVPRLLDFAWKLWLEKNDLLAIRQKHQCMIL